MIFYYFYSMILIFLSILMMIMFLLFFFYNLKIYLEFNLMILNSVEINYLIYLDWMTLIFMMTILLISSMILLYSSEYMKFEKLYKEFMYMILLFIMSMFLMIISPNLISIIMGWDGLGLISYLLIIFYQNFKSFNAGLLTIMFNRLGDIMLMLLISMNLMFGSWNLMFYLKFYKIMFMLLLICSMTKSAQMPFSIWLPAAMAAPTPVSALVHSSTLVTAGVYLIIRFNLIMNMNLMKYLLLISMFTMLISGLMANFEFDLKKIIALSTLSQLGLMMTILSINFYQLTFFHLLTHAMFKSLLFMCSGVIIHLMNNNQDIRFMGSLINLNPMLMMFFNISNLSLSGFYFLSGFFSKDLIIEFLLFLNFSNLFNYLFMYMSMIMTMMYSFRLIYYSFTSNFKNFSYMMIKENFLMNFSMIILLIMSIFLGNLLNWLLFYSIHEIFLNMKMKLLISMFFFFSLLMSYFFNINKWMKNFNFLLIKNFLNNMLFMLFLLKMINMIIMKFSMYMYLNLEKGWLEKLIFYQINFIMFNLSKIELIYFNKFNLFLMMISMMIFMILIF